MMWFLSFLFGSGLAFALSLKIFAGILDKSNNLGDQHAAKEQYACRLHLSYKENRMGGNEDSRKKAVASHNVSLKKGLTLPKGSSKVHVMTYDELKEIYGPNYVLGEKGIL